MRSRYLLSPRVLATATLTVTIAWYLLPFVERDWVDSTTLEILSFGGAGASLELPFWTYWVFLTANLLVLAIAIVAPSSASNWLIGFIVLSVVIFVPTGGLSIETGLSAMLRDTGNALFGALIVSCLLYPTRRHNKR